MLKPQEFEPPPLVDWHLRNWRDWMRRDSLHLGYPSKSAGLHTGGISGPDAFDHLCESADEHAAIVINGVIDDLVPAESAAVHYIYLHAVYRVRDFEAQFENAIGKIGRALFAKGLA